MGNVASWRRMKRGIVVFGVALLGACSSDPDTAPDEPSKSAAEGGAAQNGAQNEERRSTPAAAAPIEGFGELTRDAAAACAPDADAEALEDHACFHVAQGPFETLQAGPPSAPGTLAQTHTAYTVKVASRAARWVAFRADAAASYAFLFGAEAEVATFSPDGAVKVPLCEGPSTGICDGLPRSLVLPFAKDETVLLGLTPSAGGELLVVVEEVE